jgi:hypothetical protein
MCILDIKFSYPEKITIINILAAKEISTRLSIKNKTPAISVS